MVISKQKKFRKDLGESGALGPHTAIMADNGGSRQMVALDFAHQMIINVCLPRHLRSEISTVDFFF
jgi:hypothetical protein